jgi:hypothetical protein
MMPIMIRVNRAVVVIFNSFEWFEKIVFKNNEFVSELFNSASFFKFAE